MIDVTKASRETREEFEAAADDYERSPSHAASVRVARAVAKLRAECAPKLRSRAQVEADRAQVERQFFAEFVSLNPTWGPKTVTLLEQEGTFDVLLMMRSLITKHDRLCAEPTAEEPAELDLSDHEVCGCEEAEQLRGRIAALEVELTSSRGATYHWEKLAKRHEESLRSAWARVKTFSEKIDAALGALQ